MRFEDQRKLMIKEQIIQRGITEENIINSFLKVERHLFVPIDLQHLSYHDYPLGIGAGQTISQPYTVAYMLNLLDITSTDIVLEIGTGSGYQTALLAELSQYVYTVERIKVLSINAKILLSEMGYNNIYFQVGDGSKGWEKGEPICKAFDKIIVSAAAPTIPKSLLKQLNDNGKMVIPIGNRYQQEMVVITRGKNKYLKSTYS